MALSSKIALFSGFMKATPIRHWPADELYFLAVFKKMISSSSGLMISSTKMRGLTKWECWYVKSRMKACSKLPYFGRSGFASSPKAIYWYRYWTHSKYKLRSFLLLSPSWPTAQQLPKHQPAQELSPIHHTSPASSSLLVLRGSSGSTSSVPVKFTK